MSFLDDETTEEHERRIVSCRSCRARIIFLRTNNNRTMPVDADTVKPEDEEYDQKAGHVSHFATCTDPAAFRRR